MNTSSQSTIIKLSEKLIYTLVGFAWSVRPESGSVFFTIYGYIMNSQCGQLPDGLIAQLVEHCTGIVEIMGSNPVQAWIVFSL